ADGKVGYDAAASSTFKAQLQALAVGETLTDSFTYAIRLGNGTLSWATATIQFTGENDGPTILGASTSGAPQLGAVVEDEPTLPSAVIQILAPHLLVSQDIASTRAVSWVKR